MVSTRKNIESGGLDAFAICQSSSALFCLGFIVIFRNQFELVRLPCLAVGLHFVCFGHFLSEPTSLDPSSMVS